jgi:raffinose synthase
MVYPDFDMFESTNPNAVFHAVARAINNGPIYVTDKIDKHNFDVLFPLVFGDGKILRADKPLLPTEDCLFQIQDAKPFKAFSFKGNVGLLGSWNCADSDSVHGSIKAADVHGIVGENFVLYEYFNKEIKLVKRDEEIPLSLKRFGCKLFYLVPVSFGKAVFGLINKYNAPASILDSKITEDKISAMVYEAGIFAAYSEYRPVHVKVNGIECDYELNNRLLTVNVNVSGISGNCVIEIDF